MYEIYENTFIYKSCLYPLKRKIFIFKNLKRNSGLCTKYTKIRLFIKAVYIR